MQYRLLLIGLLCLVSLSARSQEHQRVEPSPDAMSSIRNVQSAVDHSKGVANISVPLFTVSEQDIQVPIYVGYQTSGIKVEDIASSVGLGWNLSAGGRVTRIVRKFPDEKGYYKKIILPDGDRPPGGNYVEYNEVGWSKNWSFSNSYDIHSYVFNKNNMAASFRYTINNLHGYINVGYHKYENYIELDFEPDLFFFDIPGMSGMFVLDHNGTVHTIPYRNVTINFIDKTYFVIKDPNGNIYTLGKNADTRDVSHITYTDDNSGKTVPC